MHVNINEHQQFKMAIVMPFGFYFKIPGNIANI